MLEKVQTSPLVEVMILGEKEVFQAEIYAYRQNGAPISIHTKAGAFSMEQMAMLQAGGVPADKIIIVHLDLRLD